MHSVHIDGFHPDQAKDYSQNASSLCSLTGTMSDNAVCWLLFVKRIVVWRIGCKSFVGFLAFDWIEEFDAKCYLKQS